MSRRHSRHAKITSRHQARHAKPAPPGPSALIGTAAKAVPASLAVGAAGSALALSGTASAVAATTPGAPVAAATAAAPLSSPATLAAVTTAAARPPAARAHLAAARTTYTVVSGDTLSAISARFCATPADYPSLASASHIANANLIYAGQAIALACHAAVAPVPAAAAAPSSTGSDQAAPAASSSQPPAPAPAPPAVDAATNVGTAGMPAFESCVISHESGGNPQAVNASSGAGGLFQFLPSTWAGLGYAAAYPGGAQTAPVSVQEAAFDKLYAEAGTSPWGPYDGC
jgi:LysM repeat protein